MGCESAHLFGYQFRNIHGINADLVKTSCPHAGPTEAKSDFCDHG